MEKLSTLSSRVRIVSRQDISLDVVKFTLVDIGGVQLPPFSPGAHIDVHLPSGLVRQYSLCNSQSDSSYEIAVKREAHGRGGSVQMHMLDVGSIVDVGFPRNNFPLVAGPHLSVFVAGGIGITPICSMIEALQNNSAEWILHYCARSQSHAAFWEYLQTLAPGRVKGYFSEAPVLNVPALISDLPDDAHIYCCGPAGLMDAVASATQTRVASRVHFESFQRATMEAAGAHSFEVELHRSGVVFGIPEDRSILDVLKANGIDVQSSCEQGICGTCEVAVLKGEPDHRDSVLSAEEKAANRTMMICVSRAKNKKLVLDL